MLVNCSRCNKYEPLTGPSYTVNIRLDKGYRDKDNPLLLDGSDKIFCNECARQIMVVGYADETEIREAEIALFVDTDEEDEEE